MDWSFSAQTLLDQLSPDVQKSALHGLSRLEARIKRDAPLPEDLELLGRETTGNVYSFRVLPNLVLAIRQRGRSLEVIDVARREQIEFLRGLTEGHHVLER